MTSEPVELMCMSCAMSRLFVLMYSQEIRTRMAVMAKAKATKNGNQYARWGVAVPR